MDLSSMQPRHGSLICYILSTGVLRAERCFSEAVEGGEGGGGTPPASPAPVTDPTAAASTEGTPPPAPAAAQPQPPAAAAAKVLTIPTNAMSRIKQEERERGRSQTLAELDERAVQLGFSNHEEMLEYVQANPRSAAAQAMPVPGAADPQAQPPAEQQPAAAQPPAEPSKAEAQAVEALKLEQKKLLDEKRKLNRAFARESKERKKLQQALEQKETELELKLAATRAGVTDVDYAVTVLQRAIQGMSEEELKGFDESKFFREQLRQSHPHLYQVEERPVTTGTSTAAAPAAAKPGSKPEGPEGEKKAVDARKLSSEEFQALLRKRGLSNPSTGGMLA